MQAKALIKKVDATLAKVEANTLSDTLDVLIHMLPYTPANTTADEESKRVEDTIGEARAKALFKTLVQAIEVVKVKIGFNTLNNRKAEAILNMAP